MSFKPRKWVNADGSKGQGWKIHVVETSPKGRLEVRKAAPKGSDRNAARTYESQVRTAIREGKWCARDNEFADRCKCTLAKAPATADQTIKEFATTWQARNRRECASGTVTFYADCLKHIEAQLGDALVKHVEFEHVESFKAYLQDVAELSPTTTNNVLRGLRAMLRYAEKSGKFGKDGRAPAVVLVPEEKKKGKYLTPEQAEAVKKWTAQFEPEWLDYATTMLGTGIRTCEQVALERRHVDVKEGVLRVSQSYYRGEFTPAGSAERTIPLEAEVLAVMKRRLTPKSLKSPFVFPGSRGQHMTEASPRGYFKRLTKFMRGNAEDGGVSGHRDVEPYTRADNVTAHVFRHTFATRKISEGVDIMVLKELMGHASIDTTMIYARVTDEKLREAMGQRGVK